MTAVSDKEDIDVAIAGIADAVIEEPLSVGRVCGEGVGDVEFDEDGEPSPVSCGTVVEQEDAVVERGKGVAAPGVVGEVEENRDDEASFEECVEDDNTNVVKGADRELEHTLITSTRKLRKAKFCNGTQQVESLTLSHISIS
ncbi:hypothetical protein NLI96_g10344 [Meripilus lineatus]|uniref:Uncharacterized protein n=1 Tax=Meripilus lineatus TaxID=2056292 RepID=A0AAD5UYF6_9APHY|nr:hypothetical protein NLI96_g10344 [Physisporinus lineatus]